jgi:hypothetical protein
MTVSNFFDDLSNSRHLEDLLALAGEGSSVRLEQFRKLACGRAETSFVEKHGDHWTRTLIDFAIRAGIGELRQDPMTGALSFMPSDDLPTAEQAWQRVSDSGVASSPMEETANG